MFTINKFLCFICMLHAVVCEENPNLTEYLHAQHQQVDITVKQYADIRVKIQFDVDTSDDLPATYRNAKTFKLLNSSYVITDTGIFLLQTTNYTLNLQKPVEHSGEIVFVKFVDYQNIGFLLVVLSDGSSCLHTRENGVFDLHVQRFSGFNSDATFFVESDDLYLIVAYFSETIIYKWLGAHFDEINVVPTEGAVSVTSFHETDRQIIVLPQKLCCTMVYEFSSGGLLRKLQRLPTRNATGCLSYTLADRRFLITFQENGVGYLWMWDGGNSFEFLSPMSHFFDTRTTLLHYANDVPLIFTFTNKTVTILHHSLNAVNVLKEINFEFRAISDVLITTGSKPAMLIFAVKQNSDAIVDIIPFSLEISYDEPSEKIDRLLECMFKLEGNLDNNTMFEKKSGKSVPTFADNSLKSAAYVDYQDELRAIQDDVKYATERIETLKAQMQTPNTTKEAEIVFDAKTVFNGRLHAKQLSAKNLCMRRLNGFVWTPEKWLSYDKNQTINGPVVVKKLIANEFHSPTQGKFFKDALLQHKNDKIDGSATFDYLNASKVYVSTINDLSLDDVYQKSNPKKIEGVKTFDFLNAKKIEMGNFNKQRSLTFASNLTVKNLEVEEIDGVHWNTFKDSVFRFGVTTKISGNIEIQTFKTNHLYAKEIGGTQTDTFLTTTTNQTVNSDIKFSNVDVQNLEVNKINGIDAKENLASYGQNPRKIITGPVRIDSISSLGDIHFNYTDAELDVSGIVGTNASDLLQFYHKKVKITGNLYLKNVVLAENAGVVVDGEEFKTDVEYWSKTKNQVIPAHVVTTTCTIPHLSTSNLNGVPLKAYLINNTDAPLPADIIFKNVTVLGNIFTNTDSKHFPDLMKLNATSVKYTGSFQINGNKIFKKDVKVKHLRTAILDETATSSGLTIHSQGKVTGKKIFEQIIVEKDLTSETASVTLLNGVDLFELQNKSMYVDETAQLNGMNFLNMTARNLTVAKINGKDFGTYIQSLNDVYTVNTLNTVQVVGNLTIKTVHHLSKMNNIDMGPVLSGTNKDKTPFFLDNNVRFMGKVHVNDFNGRYINGHNFDLLTRRLLYKEYNQNITALHSFGVIRAYNIFVTTVNNVPFENILDTKSKNPQQLAVKSTFVLNCANFMASIQAKNLQCDVNKAVINLQNPETRKWEYLDVLQNATLFDSTSSLSRIINDAVVNGKRNIISSSVSFENHISANSVQAFKTVNGINLTHLVNDIVLNLEEQVISGYKIFTYLTTSDAQVIGNAEVPTINEIVMSNLNRSIISTVGDAKIRGKKLFFAGLQTDRFYSDVVSGVDSSKFANIKQLQPITEETFFDNIEISSDLNIGFVNNMNVSDVFNNRLLCDDSKQVAEGVYYFDDVSLTNYSSTLHINEIKPEDVVVDDSSQHIVSDKHFLQPLHLHKSVKTGSVNGFDLQNHYERALLNGQRKTVKNIRCNDACNIAVGISSNSINSVAIPLVHKMLEENKPSSLAETIHNTVENTETNIFRCLKTIERLPDKYFYIEKSREIPIVMSDIVGAQAISVGNDVLVHVQQKRSGFNCGIPEICDCPVQSTIHISPEQSINFFVDPGYQRVFNYEANRATIHLVTNSVSSSSVCRTNSSKVLNEIALLTWSRFSNGNLSTVSYSYPNITGYISGVQFFALKDGHTYAVVCRYYDPVLDTHDLGCMVLKFTKEFDNVEVIQTIPIQWAWEPYLLHTAQGITLIIGQKPVYTNFSSDTNVYRFYAKEERFVLLRVIKTSDSTTVAGVVMGTDSLIVIAENGAKQMQIYKYSPEYDTYFYHQDYHLDSPVLALSAFYLGGFGISDAYLCVVTDSGNFYIYSYQSVEGWKLKSTGGSDGLKILVPYKQNENTYILSLSSTANSVLIVFKNTD